MSPPLPSQLGPYRILGLLGSGAMATVYRARDDRLQRDVAVKVLREAVGGKPERKARLIEEARAASALSHPNIATIFDIGIDADTPYVVSEMVEGETLRHAVDNGPLPMARLLSLAAQIADAMAAAHAAGITHGDLKPENVMITRSDRVKIVDFGLATAIEQLTSSANESRGPSDTLPGLIIGTVAYASPERARGSPVDARSDQFSFGVMLFEMATGARPYTRDSPVETLSAIISDDAPDARSLNPKVPSAVQWILERCLAKTPADRYVATADLVLDLRAVRHRTTDQSVEVGTRISRRQRDRAVAAAAGVVIGGLGLTMWLWAVWRPERVALVEHTYKPLATDPGFQGKPAWSPDGTTVAYVAEVDGVLQVFIRGVDASKATQITFNPFDSDNPFWSPDGKIYYHSPRGTKIGLYRIAAVGGAPELMEANATLAAISPDGKTLAFLKEESDQGGTLTLWFESPPGAVPHRYDEPPLSQVRLSSATPRFSPDSTRLLLWFQRWFADRDVVPFSGFFEISMKDGRCRQVLQSLSESLVPQTFGWFPDNRRIVTMLGDNQSAAVHLWMADIDKNIGWPITSGSGTEGFPAVARDGRIAYTQEETNFDIVFVPLDGSPLQATLAGSRDEFDPAWSRSGQEFAYVTDQGGPLEIRRRVAGEDISLVIPADFGSEPTFALGAPAFSPDGNSIAYQRFSPKGYRLWLSTRARSQPTRLSLDEKYQDAPSWSPTGEVAFVQASEGHWNLAKVRPGGRAVNVLLDAVVAYSRPQWSPDGSLIAFQSPSGLSVVDPNGEKRRDISRDDWLVFAWNPLDNRLYGLTRDDDRVHFSLTRIDPNTGVELTIAPRLGLVPIANQPIRGFTWTGRGFASSIAHVKSDLWMLNGLARPRSFLELFGPVGPRQ